MLFEKSRTSLRGELPRLDRLPSAQQPHDSKSNKIHSSNADPCKPEMIHAALPLRQHVAPRYSFTRAQSLACLRNNVDVRILPRYRGIMHGRLQWHVAWALVNVLKLPMYRGRSACARIIQQEGIQQSSFTNRAGRLTRLGSICSMI